MKISICGDICPTYTNELWAAGETEVLFHDVPTAFSDSDRVIVNMECSLTEADTPIRKIGPNLKASPLCAKVLKEVGVTDCALSNNHIFDLGVQGAKDTIEALTKEGLNYTGFGDNYEAARNNLVMEKEGISVAIIDVCEHEYCYALTNRMGARGFDVFDTMEDIQKAKAENDYVVVLYHGGKEQSIYPSPRLRKQSQAMIKQGADVVLCQHSHCVGCYEQYKGGHILYGQGNFHFAERNTDHPHWQNGLIVQLDIEDSLKLDFVPVKLVKNGIELAKGEDAVKIMGLLKEQSDNLATDGWLRGWEQFCEENKEWYLNVIKDSYAKDMSSDNNEMFAHYLYCEAHRDVWEQLCKLSWETRKEP